MKRVANILTVFVAMFIFMFFYQNISLEHYNSISNLTSSYAEITKKDHVTINYSLYDDNDTEVFQKLVGFLEEFNYDAISGEQNKRYNFIIDDTVYLYTQDNLNDLDIFKSRYGIDIDFTSNNNSYYSSFIKDNEATDIIDFIDKSYHKEYQPKLTIKQFKSFLSDNPSKRIATIYIYADGYDSLIENIAKSEISNYIISDDFTSYELTEAEVLNIDAIKILLILTIASLIIISVCDLLQEKKEITIRKLFGERNSSIYFDLIAKRYLFNLTLYIVTQVLLYIVIISGVRPIHTLLLKPLLLVFGLYFLIWIFANLVSFFILTRVGRPINLKQSNAIKFTNSSTLLIKVLLIVLMINPFMSLFISAPLTVEENIILRKNIKQMKDNLAIYAIDDSSENYDFMEALNLTLDFLQDLDVVYHDFSSNYIPEELKQQVPQGTFPELPYIVANNNYLKNYKIEDLDGNRIDVNLLKNNSLLVPEIYKDEAFNETYCQGPCMNIIYIQNNDKFYSHYPLVINIEHLRQDNPVILFKNQLDANIKWNEGFLSIPNKKDTQKKVNDFLSNNKLDKVVYITSTDNVYNTVVSRSNDQVFNSILTLCLYILMIFIFQYQTIFVYFSENKDEIAVNYLFGKTYLQRYGALILASITIYILPLFIGIKFMKIDYKFMLMYIMFGIILDLIVSTVMIRSFEKKKTLSVLKGE